MGWDDGGFRDGMDGFGCAKLALCCALVWVPIIVRGCGGLSFWSTFCVGTSHDVVIEKPLLSVVSSVPYLPKSVARAWLRKRVTLPGGLV